MGRLPDLPAESHDLVAWLAKAPKGTLLPAEGLRELLEALMGPQPAVSRASAVVEPTWRERLWTAPPETRIGVRELAEALGRPPSWVYRHTAPTSDLAPIPHRKLEGELVFVVAEIRAWIEAHEVVVRAPTLLLSSTRTPKSEGACHSQRQLPGTTPAPGGAAGQARHQAVEKS